MSRKKTEMNPQRAENLKKLIEREDITQAELAERIHMTQQNISRIVQMRQPLTEETAKEIIQAFPGYRIEWLLGYDDYPTTGDQFRAVLQIGREENNLLHTGLFSFLQLSDFRIDLAESASDIQSVIDNVKQCCTISRDGKSVKFSMQELNAFENEIFDYIVFRLDHMIK